MPQLEGLLYALFHCLLYILFFLINYFNYFDYFTIISIISNQYYTYYSKWKLLNQLFYTEINYIFSIAIISIKLIYYYTNYSILPVQGGWNGPNCTSHSLHVTGPRHWPRIDEPHPASIASTGTRPAVTRCAWKQIAQMVQNRACVPNWHKRKFSQDMLNRDDIQDWFSMVKLVYNLGSNWFQPSCRNEIITIMYIIRINRIIHLIHRIRLIHVWRIIRIIRIIHINHITTIFRIVVCFHGWHKYIRCTPGNLVCPSTK